MPFKKGKSGNPAGKPRGAKDKRTALRELLEPHKAKLVRKAVELALKGDTTALRLCIDRLMPPLRAKDEPLQLSGFEGSLTEQVRRVVRALAGGEISPDEAGAVMATLRAQTEIEKADELAQRMTAIEERLAKKEQERYGKT